MDSSSRNDRKIKKHYSFLPHLYSIQFTVTVGVALLSHGKSVIFLVYFEYNICTPYFSISFRRNGLVYAAGCIERVSENQKGITKVGLSKVN